MSNLRVLAVVCPLALTLILGVPTQPPVKLVITILDAHSHKPLETTVDIYCLKYGKPWEALRGRWRERVHCGTFLAEGGRLEVEVPFCYKYLIYVHGKWRETTYGRMPLYEPSWLTVRFNGSFSIPVVVNLHPVGTLIIDLEDPRGRRITFRSWRQVEEYNGGFFNGVALSSGDVCGYLIVNNKLGVMVPARTPSMVVWAAEVPGYGWAVLRADNGGRGYFLPKGDYRRVNLVYDTTVTMLRIVKEQVSSLGAEYLKAISPRLKRAEDILMEYFLTPPEKRKGGPLWRALSEILLAREEAALEFSRRSISENRMGDLTVRITYPNGTLARDVRVVVKPVYLDFFFYVEPYVDSDWMRLNRFFRGALAWSFQQMVGPSGYLNRSVLTAAVEWLVNVTGALRLVADPGTFAPGLRLSALELGLLETNYPQWLVRTFLTGSFGENIVSAYYNFVRSYVDALKKFRPICYFVCDGFSAPDVIVWNRTPEGLFWADFATPDVKREWINRTIEIVRMADPNACVCVGLGPIREPYYGTLWERLELSLSGSHPGTLLEGIKALGLEGKIPCATVEVRGGAPWGVWELWTVFKNLRDLASAVDKIWISAMDYPSAPSPHHSRPWRCRFSEENQAAFLRNLMVVLLGNPHIKGAIYLRWQDKPDDPTGLKARNDTLKPAYWALLDLFRDLTFEGVLENGSTARTMEGLYEVQVYRGTELVHVSKVQVRGGGETVIHYTLSG